MPIRIMRLFKEGVEKMANPIDQHNIVDNSIKPIIDVKLGSNIITKQKKIKLELHF